MSDKALKIALEFEAIICEVTAISIDVAAMKAGNKDREYRNMPPAYTEERFREAATVMRKYAEKIRALGRKQPIVS